MMAMKHWRTLVLVAVWGLSLPLDPASAQERAARDTAVRRGLPADVQREVVQRYNGAALRVGGRMEVDTGRVVEGTLAVLRGPVVIAGRVRGAVVAINADVILRSGAVVDGDLIVVGGEVEGIRAGAVGGETRIYRDPLRYAEEGDRLVIVEADDDEPGSDWWRRWERRRVRGQSTFHIGSAGAYNRVEGLPINIGPWIRHNTGDARLHLDAFVVLRTETLFKHDSSDVGYDARLELRPRRRGVAVGGRAYDVNAPVEAWQLSDLEAGLSAFISRRDYRDYHGRRGGSGYVSLVDRYWGEVSLSYGHEHWGPRAGADPWSLLYSGSAWRENPLMDEGRMHLVHLNGRLDTRNDRLEPKDGWLVLLEIERGTGRLSQFGPTSPGVRVTPTVPVGGAPSRYLRGMIDVRRYTRLSPHGQLNMRGVLGGWLSGDELPLQRRLSVDGGVMPGLGFRRGRGLEAGVCATVSTAPPGIPAQCERIALGQVEFRGELPWEVSLFGWPLGRAEWVTFGDIGRGWLVTGDASGSGGYRSDAFPSLSTFRSDIGAGIHLGFAGLYLAKSLSHGAEPPVAFVRLRRRF